MVKTAPGQESFVGAALDDLSIPDDQYLVRVADGTQPVGDDDRWPRGKTRRKVKELIRPKTGFLVIQSLRSPDLCLSEANILPDEFDQG